MKTNSKSFKNICRLILLAIAFLYSICLNQVCRLPTLHDPIPFNQRIAMIAIFLSLFILSYFSQWIEQNLDQITYLASVLAASQLIYHNYLIGFELHMAIALVLVITAINLIFKADKTSLYINLILAVWIAVALYEAEYAAVFRVTYLAIYVTAAGLSYFISYKRLKAEDEIEEGLQEQELLLNMVDIQIWYLKDELTYGKVNQAFADFIGMGKSKIQGKKITEIHSAETAQNIIESNKKAFREKEKTITEEWYPDLDGEQHLFLIMKAPKFNNKGEVEYLVCSAKDITEQKIKEDKIKFLSYKDSLTKLYNRRFLKEEMERIDTQRQLPISIIIGDVNDLKTINDRHGHKKGDELIVEAARIFKQAVRNEDILARWGGDEFAVLLPKTSAEEAQKVIDRIREECSMTDDDELNVSIALGLATKTNMYQEIEEVLIQADKAMYADKVSTKDEK